MSISAIFHINNIYQYNLQYNTFKLQELNLTSSLAGTPTPGLDLPKVLDGWTLEPEVSEFLSKPIINPHPYGYLHNEETKCGINKTKLLFVIPSAPDNFDRRDWVRNSKLGSFVKQHSSNVTLLFFLGFPSYKDAETHHIQRSVNYESTIYRDIVQANFTDQYRDIRLKAQLMLKWASTYCYNASYVIRSDDDVIFDVENIVDIILRTGAGQYRDTNFILGTVKKGFPVLRAGSENEKNDVTFEEYPGEFYPPFALGGLLGYPLAAVRLLYEASLREPSLWLDDVYITALCAPKVKVILLEDPKWRFYHISLSLTHWI